MIDYGNRTILHIDVNSAFLSWEAVYQLQKGKTIDIREIPSVIGGSQADRRGIVLAKSIPAKKLGVETGEVLWKAKRKCPNLAVFPPNYGLYMKCSNSLYELLQEYSPKIQRFSIDECFLDYTGMEKDYGDPVEAAHKIKERIKTELGFTVNIGIGRNKLTAKMAGELKKPDMVHTIYPDEIAKKMWVLPIRELFMVGRQTEKKLKQLNIMTIGEIASADPELLKSRLNSFGVLIWQYANGIDDSPVESGYNLVMKGIGNSTTIRFDVDEYKTAHKILLSLVESVSQRLRAAHSCCRVVSVEIKSSELSSYSHQRKLFTQTNITNEIYQAAKDLFDEMWKKEKIRHLGVRVSDLCSDNFLQTSIFDGKNIEKKQAIDKAVDCIRNKYGNLAVFRAVFADREVPPMEGGSGAEDYPVMSSIL